MESELGQIMGQMVQFRDGSHWSWDPCATRERDQLTHIEIFTGQDAVAKPEKRRPMQWRIQRGPSRLRPPPPWATDLRRHSRSC